MRKLFFLTFWSFLITLAPQTLLANEKSALEIGEDEFVIGDKDAPITIIEYASVRREFIELIVIFSSFV